MRLSQLSSPASVQKRLFRGQLTSSLLLLLLSSCRPVVVVPGPCAPVARVGHQGVRPIRDRHVNVSEHRRQRALQDGQGRLPPAHQHVQRRSASLSSQLPQGK